MSNLPAENLEYILSALRHEIMNPLSRIILNLELLEETPENKEIKVEINNIVNEVTSIVKNSIELYSKIESLDILAVVGKLIMKDYPSVTFLPNAKELIVESSEGGIRQIMHNLLSNALKYNPEGRCEVEAKEVGQYLSIRVKDDGAEIPQEFVELIFQRGYRLPRDLDKDGDGIGLHVSKGLAKRLKGELSYFREKEKNIFELLIPLAISN